MAPNADTILTIIMGTETVRVKYDSKKLDVLEKWFATTKDAFKPGTKKPYEATIDLNGKLPLVLAFVWTDLEVVEAVKALLRMMTDPAKKGPESLDMKNILLVSLMNETVLGLPASWNKWIQDCARFEGKKITDRASAGEPVDAAEYELAFYTYIRLGYRNEFAVFAAALIFSATVVNTPGCKRLKPTGAGVVDGSLCGAVAAEGLYDAWRELARHVISSVHNGITRWNHSMFKGGESCRKCIRNRCGALMEAMRDLGLWPHKEPEDLEGKSLLAFQKAMRDAGNGVNISEKVAKYAGWCRVPDHADLTDGDNLFAIDDVSFETWDGVAGKAHLEVLAAPASRFLWDGGKKEAVYDFRV